MPSEEMLVLASSKKLGGRCVAGITRSGNWVRPVSGRPQGLLKPECEVEGSWPEVLDVVRFGYEEELDDPAQPENLLIDDSRWELLRQVPRDEAYGRLSGFLDEGHTLLGNRGRAVPEETAAQGVEASLALVEPRDGVSLIMRPPEEEYGQYKPRVEFGFGARVYALAVTDIPVRAAVRAAGVGEYSPSDLGFDDTGPTLLTVSLGEAHDGWHTKLAAAVIFLPGG
ncbi:MAG TPA: hypothetical protein VFY69_04345 [Solirubrobacterales bacterium]|nr:hypothetical protein [Solirubrobacterales bacterium]